MSRARNLADFISTGTGTGILADGAISSSEISDLTASALEINKLDGLNASTAELNHIVGATSALQTQIDAKLPLSGGTLTGDVVAPRFVDSGSSGYFLDPYGTSVLAYSYLQQSYAYTSALTGTNVNVTADTHSSFSLTTSGTTTFTFSVGNVTSGYLLGFVLKLTAGGAHTINFPASVDWAGGTAPDAPASGETDILTFFSYDGGTTWYGNLVIDAAS
jgi:hypothetical protein